MDTASFIAIGLAFFAVAVSPGPANITNAVVAMSHGRRASFVYSVGLTVGIALWGIVAATGLGAVMQTSVVLFSALKVLGGLYLLWLAWQSGRGAMAPAPDAGVKIATGRWFWRGLILNVSNPKTVVAWMAALAVGLDANATAGALAAGVILCTLVAFGVFLGYMLVFSHARMRAGYRRVSRAVGFAIAGLYTVAGLSLLRSAFAR